MQPFHQRQARLKIGGEEREYSFTLAAATLELRAAPAAAVDQQRRGLDLAPLAASAEPGGGAARK